MSQGSDTEESLTVSNDGVTVEKTVTATEFPVPAVVFTLQSNASTSVHVRLTDRIPESFPMERVGFHPEFESDRWTAYKDHRVEFERDLDPGESVKTVYGIRADDGDDLTTFLTEPEIKEVAARETQEAADIEGVLGPDNSQLIRDVLSGERSSLPGIDEDVDDPIVGSEADDPLSTTEDPLSEDEDSYAEEALEGDQEEEPEQRVDPTGDDESDLGEVDGLLDDDGEEPLNAHHGESDPLAEHGEVDAIAGESDTTPDSDEPDAVSGDGAPGEPVEQEDEITETTADELDGEATAVSTAGSAGEMAETDEDTAETDEDTAESDEESDDIPIQPAADVKTENTHTPEDGSSLVAVQGGIAAVLAAEIRNDNVSEEDMALLKKELGTDVPRSVEVRLSRLQSQVETFAAYSEALESFIDENGTADELLAQVDNGLDALEETVDDLTIDVSDAADEREALSGDIRSVKTTAESTADRVDTLEADLTDTTAQINGVDDDLGSLIEDVDTLDSSVKTLGDDLEDAFDEIGTVAEDVETVESTIDATAEAIDDVETELTETATTAGEAAATADRVERAVGEVESTVESIEADVGGLHEAVNSVESDVTALEEELSAVAESLRSELSDATAALEQIDEKADRSTVRSLQRRIDDLEDDVETVEEFRERLSGVFMGNGPSMDDTAEDTEQ